MTWIEKKEDWFPDKGRKRKAVAIERSYTIAQMAEALAVSREIIYKWLALDDPENAVIPPTGWYRLPNGRVRIREWVIIKIQKEDI